jgi:hypothetical protein
MQYEMFATMWFSRISQKFYHTRIKIGLKKKNGKEVDCFVFEGYSWILSDMDRQVSMEFHVRQPAVNCLLPTAYCQLLIANCLLPTAYCQLLTANCLIIANCLLSTAFSLLWSTWHQIFGYLKRSWMLSSHYAKGCLRVLFDFYGIPYIYDSQLLTANCLLHNTKITIYLVTSIHWTVADLEGARATHPHPSFRPNFTIYIIKTQDLRPKIRDVFC